MNIKILRGRILSFKTEPQGIDDKDSYLYIEDGAIAIEGEKIVALGSFNKVRSKYKQYKLIDHRPHLLMAGFIDPHIHYVQTQVVASYAPNLLKWLYNYTFVEEQKFINFTHAEQIAAKFFTELINNGTTTACTFCSVHPHSVEAFFKESEKHNMAMIGGKVLMNRNCPDKLRDNPQLSYDESKRLIKKWHNRGRQKYAITPRFAITSTPEQLEAAGALLAENPDCYLQTHLSENKDEIALTKQLYPVHKDYLSIYEFYGLLGEKSLFAHSIHLSESEKDLMAQSNSVAISCPTSNLFLGSGLFNMQQMKKAGIRIGVATDIGGGTSYSMLQTMGDFYKVQQMNNYHLNPLSSFYMMTLGNALILSMEEEIGTLEVGSYADIIVLNSRATSAMELRAKTINNLSEELFLLQTLGDDRSIVQTYIAGKAAKYADKS